MLNEIEWENPYYLILFLFIPFILYLFYSYHKKTIIPVPTMQFYPKKSRYSYFFYLLLGIDFLILIFATIILINPKKVIGYSYIEEEGIDIALVLDISASMMAADFKPNRLEVLKKLSIDFIKKNKSNRIGLFLFAREVFVQGSFTTYYNALSELIDSISYYMIDHSISGGTHIGDALLVAAKNLEKIKIDGRDQAIILLTDGESEGGIDPFIVAKYIKEKNIKLFIIGIGGYEKVPVFINGEPFIDSEGNQLYTKLDDEQLKQIAEISEGLYYRAIDGNALNKIYDKIIKLNTKPLKTKKVVNYQYYNIFFVWLLLLLYTIRIFINYRILRRPAI